MCVFVIFYLVFKCLLIAVLKISLDITFLYCQNRFGLFIKTLKIDLLDFKIFIKLSDNKWILED